MGGTESRIGEVVRVTKDLKMLQALRENNCGALPENMEYFPGLLGEIVDETSSGYIVVNFGTKIGNIVLPVSAVTMYVKNKHPEHSFFDWLFGRKNIIEKNHSNDDSSVISIPT